MEKSLELIKKLKEELKKLKINFEEAYINNTNNINKIEKLDNEIKEIEKIIDQKEKKQLVIIIKRLAILLCSMVIIGSLATPLIEKAMVITIFTSMMTILLLTAIPKLEKKLYNLILKLSPKLNKLDIEINTLKNELSLKTSSKMQLELIKKDLQQQLNNAELHMINKETQLREAEEEYFNNKFDLDNKTTTINEPHKKTIKVRIKQKKNTQ